MPDWNLVGRPHVVAAMEEYDRLGDREFLRRYGFGRSRIYTVWHQGQEYDSKAILGAAYFHATGTPATRDEFNGGESGAAAVLRGLGFDVVANEQEAAAEELRAARAAARTPKAAARPRSRTATPRPRGTAADRPPAAPRTRKPTAPEPKICPTCHMAMPASGICDFCD